MASPTHRINIWSDGKIDVDTGLFGIVLHDFTMLGVSRPTRNNAPRRTLSLPEVQPYASIFSWLDPEMQDWINEICMENAGGEYSKAEQTHYMNSLFQSDTAFTNGQPNLIYGWDMTIKLYNVLSAGAIIKLLSHEPVIYKGKFSYPFQVIDTSKPYKHYSIKTHPWLFFYPVSSHRKEIWVAGKWTGKYIEDLVSTFWEYSGKTILPIHGRPLEGVDPGIGFIESFLVRKLEPGKIWPSPIDL